MAFKFNMELEDLYDKCKELEERKNSFFDDDSPNYGDRGYQDLCEQIDNICQQISDIEEEFDENPDVIDQSVLDEIHERGNYYDNDEDFIIGDSDNITIDDCN
jgi:predicted transcriptional regulator